jgi:D-sedoheptulose 7-phosphate isomerase
MKDMRNIDTYLNTVAGVLARMPRPPLARVVAILQKARQERRCIFVFGNGGSAATASHFVVDILKGTLDDSQPRFRIVCLNDNIPTLTALANDTGYDCVFAEPLASLAEHGDVAIAISGSGNSANVLKAMDVAGQLGLTTIGLTGGSGGKLIDMVDAAVIVPSPSMQVIEDAHLVILHAVYVELCTP